MKKTSDDLTILVLSCDKYKDLWKPFFYCFDKYWSDCLYPVVLGSNTKAFKDKKIQTIFSGPDKDWSSSLRAILDQIRTPYVFLWLDDIFPIERIDENLFAETIAFMSRTKAKHVHVGPTPVPDRVIENGKYGMYERSAPYRVTVFGFWEVSTLEKMIISGENPWNFEIMGSYRSSYDDGFYCVMKNIISRVHVVEKGKIFREAYRFCKENNIPLDVGARSILEEGSFLKSEIQKLYFNMFIRISWKTRLSIMNVLRKLLISY